MNAPTAGPARRPSAGGPSSRHHPAPEGGRSPDFRRPSAALHRGTGVVLVARKGSGDSQPVRGGHSARWCAPDVGVPSSSPPSAGGPSSRRHRRLHLQQELGELADPFVGSPSSRRVLGYRHRRRGRARRPFAGGPSSRRAEPGRRRGAPVGSPPVGGRALHRGIGGVPVGPWICANRRPFAGGPSSRQFNRPSAVHHDNALVARSRAALDRGLFNCHVAGWNENARRPSSGGLYRGVSSVRYQRQVPMIAAR
jgi:hypothetical protein